MEQPQSKSRQNPLNAIKRRAVAQKEDQLQQQQKSGLPAPTNYAVCPPPSYASDHMKKSLPRRKKAIVPPALGAMNTLAKTTPTVV